MKKGGTVRVKEGSGNVFADLGFPNPEREQLKAQLTCLSQLGSSAAGKPFRISGGVQKVSTTTWVCVLGESSWSHQAVRSFAMRS